MPKPYQEHHITMPSSRGSSIAHTLYAAEYGNPRSKRPTVVILHGGPGVPSEPLMATLCDLKTTRVVLYDQRGCGRSTPLGCLHANTTRHQIGDIERLRVELGLGDRIALVGGSWGASLAIMYAAAYPERVSWYVVRGFCAVDRVTIFAPTIRLQYPEMWKRYTDTARASQFAKCVRSSRSQRTQRTQRSQRSQRSQKNQQNSKADSVQQQPTRKCERQLTERECAAVYYKEMRARCSNPPTSDADPVMKYVDAWYNLEMSTLTADPADTPVDRDTPTERWVAALFEAHYYTRQFFVKRGYYERVAAKSIREACVPGTLIHGRQDVICNVTDSYDLHRWLTNSGSNPTSLVIVEKAGHSYYDPRIRDAMIKAIQHYNRIRK